MGSKNSIKWWPVRERYYFGDDALCEGGDLTREYNPLKCQEVLGEFAKLREGDEKRLIRFARDWGLIGWPLSGEDLEPPRKGEPLDWIWGHVETVSLGLRLHDYLQRGDFGGLSKYVDSHPRCAVSQAEQALVVDISDTVGLMPSPRIPLAGPESMGEKILEYILNYNLREVVYRAYSMPWRLEAYSPSLLGAVYWHLATLVVGGGPLARCEEQTCGALFVLRRRDQHFCPRPSGKGKGGSACGALHRKRAERLR